MEMTQQMALQQKLEGLNLQTLRTVAAAALAECENLECQQDVLGQALTRAGSLMPTHVDETGRIIIGNGAAALVGILRGSLGEIWGRAAALAPMLTSLTFGLASKDASMKAAGYAGLLGSTASETGIEFFELGQILRAKLGTKVTKGQAVASPA